MTQLLDRAVNEARKLPTDEQEAIGAIILDEIEDDRQWEESFARSPETLNRLVARAKEQVKPGQCRSFK